MREIVGFLAILMTSAALAAPTAKAPPAVTGTRQIADRVAAVVNSEVILISELDQRMLPLRAQAAQITDKAERDRRLAQLARQMLDEMINDELMLEAARAARLSVTDDEVKHAIGVIQKDHGLDDKQLDEAMKQQGITKETIRASLLRHRALNVLVAPKIQVNPEDVRAKYDQMSRRADAVTGVNISQIVFGLPDTASVSDIADAKRKAQDVVDRSKAGESFATLAAAVASPTVATTDGVWVDSGTVIPELEPVVFGMDKGDVRGPVKGPAGFYVVFANDVRRTQLKPFADMKGEIENELRQKALLKLQQTWVEELRKKAYIEIKLD